VLGGAVYGFISSPVQADETGTFRAATARDFQAALDAARPGQTIVLEAGRVYAGPFTLPKKDGDAWITIRTSAPDRYFATPGTRVTPADARMMPTLVSATGSVLTTEPGAHHYRFIGLEITPAPGTFLYDLVHLGTDSSDPAVIPHDFVVERSYLHGDPKAGTRRGIALNSAATSIVDSYFADFKEAGADSQAICGWNGPGPFHIVNNYLEGAGENLMFGGGDPSVQGLVPSDIEIRRNYFSKPITWRPESKPEGQPQWTVKNLLELKNARRVVIDGNIFEHNWLQAQVGLSILFTPRNQDGKAPWSVVEDVTFSNNIIRQVAAGVDIIGWDDIHNSQQAKRIRITNNLFTDVGGPWGFGRLFQILNGSADVTIDHNTSLQTETPVFGGDTLPHTNFVFRDNIVLHNEYGFIGSSTATGRASIERYFPGADIRRNVIVGGDASKYPSDNFFPRSVDQVGFLAAGSNYRLGTGSPFRGKGTDGRDVGANIDAIMAAIGTNAAPTAAAPRRSSAVAVPQDVTDAAGIAAIIVFWLAGGLIVYTYVGYPLLMRILARVSPKPPHPEPYLPAITIVVVAYNEAARIARRIENLLALNYPEHLRRIVVVSDGSTDDTAAIARASSPEVHVVEFEARRGKASVFNDVLPRLKTDIVVLADARQRFEPDAVRALVANFADSAVGAVSGELVLGGTGTGDPGCQGVAMYWDTEKRLRWLESQVDSSIGVTGAIVAIRRSLVEPIPPDTVLDDVLIPMRIVRRGFRVIFEPRARAFDRLPSAERDEFSRKVRTLAGNFQLFALEPWLLAPWRNRLWLQTVSHKGLRLALPLLFLAVAVANVFLLDQLFYWVTLAGQMGFYAVAVAGRKASTLGLRWGALILPYTVCFLMWATVVAFVRFLRGRQSATWERPRTWREA
jgi:cellulose synthase/poly-beta-1,6-N-acetylglucosamine synthase-like glycosyltransferase